MRKRRNKKPNIKKYVLMYKNVEVLITEYNHDSHTFKKINVIKNLDYTPISFLNNYLYRRDMRPFLNEWFKNRSIPFWRDGINLLMKKCRIMETEDLLFKNYACSLSEHYWLRPYNSQVKYEKINFFDNDFEDNKDYWFFNEEKKLKPNLKSPDNTLIGKQKKCWIIENGKRYLVKASFKDNILEPFNEVLAGEICKRLGISHVTYTLDVINGKVVSKCPCFINQDTEFVSAAQILNIYYDTDDLYNTYVRLVEEQEIAKAREKIENMLLIDYLLVNEDRHLNNFGIIRDANTLKWLDVAPIFDSGQSLNILNYDNKTIINEGKGRFFSSFLNFEKILDYIEDLNRFDLSKLKDIPKEFSHLLYKYQDLTGLSDEQIENKITLIKDRIKNVKKKQTKKGNK